MEDIKAYIESGILELYVLGDVTPEERAQVEAMAQKHPAIKAELDEIGRSLELYAEENAVEPTEHLRSRVLNSLVVNLGDDRTFGPARTAAEEEDGDIIPISRARSNMFFKYAFAACFALLIISIVALISVYNRLQESNNLVASLQSQNQRFASQTSLMDKELGVFHDPSFKMLKLQGTQKSPSSKLMVAWSPVKKKVMIDMTNANMPANDKDHQYQLWALVGDKPVDLGVFDTTSKGMKEMKSIASADAFAVTLERRGGSPTPTKDQMMVIGKF